MTSNKEERGTGEKKTRGRRWLVMVLATGFLAAGYYTGIRYVVKNLTVRETEAGESKQAVALVTKSTTSAFWRSVFAGANAAGTEYNLSVTIDGPQSEEDYETQNAMIERAVASGAGALVFSAVDYEANAAAIDAAAEKGVKIVVIDSDVNSENVSCRIGTDNYEAGRMAGRAILDSGLAELNVGIVNYDINSANGQQREEGLREVLASDERTRIVDVINVLSTTEDSLEGTKQMLKEHPEINVIATFNEWTSLGVGYAVEELGLGEETFVAAFDNNVVSVGMLESGEVDALIVQNPFAMGYLGVESAYRLLGGETLEETVVDTATTLVTRENMFDEECQKVLFAFD